MLNYTMLLAFLMLAGCNADRFRDGSGGGGSGGSTWTPPECVDEDCDDGNECTIDVCDDEDECLHLGHGEPVPCPITDKGDQGVCVWNTCIATCCERLPDFTPCFAEDHDLGKGVCVDGECHKQCEVNQACNDGIACTADWCDDDPVHPEGFCRNEDSCSVGDTCDLNTGLCVD